MTRETVRTTFRTMIPWAAALTLLVAAPALAQFQPANHFPSKPQDDGKFLALAGNRFATLSEGTLSFGLVVPQTADEVSTHPCEFPLAGDCIYLGIFDGDTEGMSVDATALADYEDLRALFGFPGFLPPVTEQNHWDNLSGTYVPPAPCPYPAADPRCAPDPTPPSGPMVPTVAGRQGTQLGFALFADANQVASRKKRDLLGVWLGDRSDNPTTGPDVLDPQWIAFSGDFEDPGFTGRGPELARFPDNALWNLELELNGCAAGDSGCPLAATGVSSFHLCIFYNPDPSVYPANLPGLLAGYGDDDDIVELCSSALKPDGSGVRPDIYPQTVSLFKLKGESDIQLLSRSFAFEGGQHNLADTSTLFPGWSPNLTTSFSGSYDPGFFLNPVTTYDGNWIFNLFLPSSYPRRELVVFGGDFDYGTTGTIGDPSGDIFMGCTDNDDEDSPDSPDFVASKGAPVPCTAANDLTWGNLCVCADLPGSPPLGTVSCNRDGSLMQSMKANGVPADDSELDQFRKIASPDPAIWPDASERKCVVYDLRSPGDDGLLDTADDVVYRNPNPSSQREWEQFRIVSRCELVDNDPAVRQCGCSFTPVPGQDLCPPGFPEALEEVFDPTKTDAEQADYVVNDDRLAKGTWRVTVYGLDLSNLNAWSTELRFCPFDPDNPDKPCPDQLVPYKVGDTVWLDGDRDGVQDFDEPGIPGVRVTLVEADQELATKVSGDEDLDNLLSCEECNTGGDPAGPADPPKNPVDEEGLFCFDVEVPPVPKRCSATSEKICTGNSDCPTGESCQPPPRVNRCSATTDQACGDDADCPTGESCVQNCRDFAVEVDEANFQPGGPLDGFGPTTPSPRQDCAICEAEGGAVTLNCDFGYAPCDECDGKVSALTLRYLGGVAAQIRVQQKNGDTVFGPSLVQAGAEFSLDAGTDKGTYGTEIELYVNGSLAIKIHTSCSQPIFAGLVLGDFEVVRGASRNGGAFCPAQCRPIQIEALEVKDDELKWRIKNLGNTPITISRVVLEWPVEKGNLKKIELDGTFYEQLVAPPTADISSGFHPDMAKRTLDVGEDKDLKFRFDDKFEAGSYAVRVEFGDSSCSLETSGTACQTDCDKPIHDLSMIWGGTQPVDVKAWKGSVGSTLLGTVLAVAPGDRVTFGDFEGSPNDVFWEIFAAGTNNKLGESKFHLSCSDDEMNGPEDCGNAEGNGKDNNSGFLNDWIFDGWRDDDEILTCSPEPICEPAPPPPGDACQTDCAKPIHELSMIWNGAQAVDVTAWKGSVGSTSLGTEFGVLPGDRVSFSDFAGSPNDVFWEVFAAGTSNKLGESKFHLSCSDDEMDGPEDCGKAEGNGKDNNSGFLNDWIFDGWQDDDEILTCSPEPICEPAPPPVGGSFDCSKPIDALTMVWNGAETIRIKAWKGSVGSALLADVDGISPGGVPGTPSEVQVTGFAGSPNDVFWEIFRSGSGTKLGESVFHLSCSDGEMDGPEDCGSPQGNGKGNDSGRINDWLLEGMVDSDEALDCTP